MGVSKLLREIELPNQNLCYFHIHYGLNNHESLGTIFLNDQM